MFNVGRVALALLLVAGLAVYAPWRRFTEAADVPEGWRTYRADAFQLSHPADWKVVTGKDRNGRSYVEISGPATEQGAYSGQIRVVRTDHWLYTLRDQLVQFRSAEPEPKFRILKDEPVLVKGAEGAHRFETSYETTTALGKGVQIRATETFVLTEERVLLRYVVRFPRDDAADGRMAAIVKSFRLRSGLF